MQIIPLCVSCTILSVNFPNLFLSTDPVLNITISPWKTKEKFLIRRPRANTLHPFYTKVLSRQLFITNLSELITKEYKYGIMSTLCKKDQNKFLGPSKQIPRVHRVHWKDDNVSRDWLERLSKLNSFVGSMKSRTAAKDIEAGPFSTEGQDEENSGLDNLRKLCNTKYVEQCYPGESLSAVDREPLKKDISEGVSHSRKPDSTYISLVSQIHVPGSGPKTSKRRFSDGNFPERRFIPEMKCVQLKDESLSPTFFVFQTNSEAKRKLSFEYIQEVSKLGCELQVN